MVEHLSLEDSFAVTDDFKQEAQEPRTPEDLVDGSISLGRFSVDTLCWERWSVFSQNRYLEEVEKCSTPGSVAKKAAYFDAHYKRIASERAVQQQYLNQAEAEDNSQINNMGSVRVHNFSGEAADLDSTGHLEGDLKTDSTGKGQNMNQNCESTEKTSGMSSPELKDDQTEEIVAQVPSVTGNETGQETGNLEAANGVERDNDNKEHNFATTGQGDAVMEAEKPSEELEDKKDERKSTKSVKEDASNSKQRKMLSRAPSTKKGSLPKQPKRNKREPETGDDAKPAKASVSNSRKGAAAPKETRQQKWERKQVSVGMNQKQKSESISLHASLSLKSTGAQKANVTVPQPFALATGRRASIMENLGDKEIVKRAFKAFQHSLSMSLPSKSESPRANPDKQKQATKKWTPKVSSHARIVPHENQSASEGKEEKAKEPKENRTTDNKSPLAENSTSAKKPIAKPSSATFNLKSDERAEKRKEFYMKLEEKMNAKEAEKNQIQAKTKEEMEAEIKKFRRSLTFRATPMPNFYQEAAPPKKEIKKLPLTRAKSPKLGRRKSDSGSSSKDDSAQCSRASRRERRCEVDEKTVANAEVLQSTRKAVTHKKKPKKDGPDSTSSRPTGEKSSENNISNNISPETHSKASATENVVLATDGQNADKIGTIQLVDHTAQETEPVLDNHSAKDAHKNGGPRHKEKTQNPKQASTSDTPEPKEGAGQPAKRPQETTTAVSVSDSVNGSTGLDKFVGDVAVAS
eukprot:TRINITY_DN956_c0_g1_i4.p1 TRINITY_DN956_c0_g1~~TRINITY_DN956_c0_g1_i4.p1  ORF type:complete len:748 (+),score=228.15 TRINITY_DN956_c0_g1_i4:726-2969(+)